MHWLVSDTLKQAMDQAVNGGVPFSAEEQLKYEARFDESAGASSRLLTIAGDQAEIRIHGSMTKRPDFLAYIFGGGNTTYPEIIQALNEAEKNDDIKHVTLDFDSGGGTIDGMFDTVAALQQFSKPTTARASGMCASAAYALAAQCDTVVATNKGVLIGSIGIIATHKIPEDTVQVRSTKAPKKNPDVSTPEGKADAVELMDDMHDLFVEAIAEGRGTTKDTVNAEYGEGATLIASEALKRGMIDSVISEEKSATPTTATSGNKPEAVMDLNELKAQHPDVYSAAVAEGQQVERDRVMAHLILADASGAHDVAAKAIRDGSEVTPLINAEHTAASIKKGATADRLSDDDDAAAATAKAEAAQAEADDKAAKDAKASAALEARLAGELNVELEA